MLDATAGT